MTAGIGLYYTVDRMLPLACRLTSLLKATILRSAFQLPSGIIKGDAP